MLQTFQSSSKSVKASWTPAKSKYSYVLSSKKRGNKQMFSTGEQKDEFHQNPFTTKVSKMKKNKDSVKISLSIIDK